MNQYLLAVCYLFTIVLLFFAFFIVRCLPPGCPLNIYLYRSNTIISLAIYNPKIATIISMTKTLGMPQYMADQSHTDTPEWIDWVFAHINLDQIREITGRLFSQNFRANYKAEHGISFRVVTLEPSIPKLEEEPVEEEQGQWEIGSNDEIPGFGNFE
jgi:hypothetical protein